MTTYPTYTVGTGVPGPGYLNGGPIGLDKTLTGANEPTYSSFGCKVPDVDPLQTPDWELAKVYFERKVFTDGNWTFFDGVNVPYWGFEDLIKASRNIRPDDGIDSFMEGQLKSPALETFRRDRLTQRAERVQHEADGKVQRLNNIVTLDDTQQDQVFSIMAHSSRDFDPQMQLEGVSADAPPTSADSRNADIRNVLRPDQQASYDNWRAEQRTRSEEEAAEIGLKIPEGWDPIDADL